MQVFSKMVKPDIEMDIINEQRISYNDYYKDKAAIHKKKMCDLKNIAKLHKLRVSGKKIELIERIENHFVKLNITIKIQSLYRRYLVKKILAARGPALKNRNLCVNDTDFYTLEPLSEIHYDNFFSYMDASGFIYGFELNSLIIMLKKQGTITNPYNRNKIEYNIIKNIKYIKKLSNPYMSIIAIDHLTNNNSIRQTILKRINDIRIKDVSIRINELFIDIDLLGNYTQSSWFSNLEKIHYLKLILELHDIWYYKANMSISVKRLICPYFDPFVEGLENIFLVRNFLTNVSNYSIDDMRKRALTIMENIIYTGIDIEYRKLGALHVLSALTLVSIPARNSLPWLYESISH
jgi:hypothetical protein